MDDRLEVVVDHPHDQYTGEDIHQLRFICLCRAMDMSLEEVRTLLSLALRRKADYRAANLALNEHIGHVRTHLTELKGLLADLTDLRGRCDGLGTKCRIVEALHSRADVVPAAGARTKPHRHV